MIKMNLKEYLEFETVKGYFETEDERKTSYNFWKKIVGDEFAEKNFGIKETNKEHRSRIAKICQNRPEVKAKKSIAMKAYHKRMNKIREMDRELCRIKKL